MNVSWLLNGTEVQINESVTEASYTNTSPAVGTWNVSAVVTNENGTVSRMWLWNVSLQVSPTPSPTPIPAPTPTPGPKPSPSPTPTHILASGATPATPFYIFGWVLYKDGNKCNAPFVVVTNLNTSEQLIAECRTKSNFYQLVTNLSFVNASDVLQINASKNGTLVGNATHIVNQTEIERGVIIADINKGVPDLVIPESGISIPPLRVKKTNVINVTVWNDGTGASSPFNVSFSVSRGNETEYEAEKRVSGLNYGSYVNINFSWMPTSEGSYNITVSVDSNHEIEELNESNNNLTMTVFVGVPDFTVTSITFNTTEPLLIGDVIEINATIANTGAKEGTTNVEFYDNKSIEITRTQDEYSGGKTITDTLILPEALKIRVHFSRIKRWSMIKIYDGNNSVVEDFNWSFWGGYNEDILKDYWTEEWASGDTIHIKSQEGEFTVDRYEAVLANESIPLDAGNCTSVFAHWNLSLQEFGWAINGTHDITVKVDTYEGNNRISETRMAVVTPSLDFAVTNISFKPEEPLLNETVELNATVANYCVRNGTATVRAYCDEILVNETVVSLNFTDLPKIVDMTWVANITNGGAGRHNISVEIDQDNIFVETNEENNSFPEQIFVNGTDLAVTDIEIPCGQFGGRRCYRDKNETITVIIANLGAHNASNFTVMLSDGLGEGNTSGVNTTFFPTNVSILSLKSGDNVTINMTWTPAEFGKHTITVSIPFDNTDNNGTNNMQFVNLSVKPEYDFAVENVSVYPEEVNETEEVTIEAKIGNSGRTSGNVSVGFYANITDFAGSGDERFIKIGKTDEPVSVEVDGKNNASITWNANVTGGHHQIFAVVDPDNNLSEWPDDTTILGESIIFKDTTKAGNNVKSCTLHVIKPDLKIKALTLDPPEPVIENMVNVTAVVENKGNKTANSTVWFYMENNVWSYMKEGNFRNWSVTQPEECMMRAHFNCIKSSGGSLAASVDEQPVFFYVKNDDVAEGQPIKVPRIDFDTPCDKCLGRNEETAVCDHKSWEDVWTNWSRGTKLEVKTAGSLYDPDISIDKYQVLLGNRTVTIDAGSNSSIYNVTWNASFPLNAGENYTLVANVEDEVVRNETYLGGTDLAVKLSVEKEIWDGTQGWINASIENVGGKNATDFLVNFTEIYVPTGGPDEYGWTVLPDKRDNNFMQFNSTSVSGLEAGNVTNISVRWNASIRKMTCNGLCIHHKIVRECPPWTEIAENYTIKVEIIPLDNIKFEVDKENHVKEERVHVKHSRDFSVTNLSFIVNDETRVPDSYGKVNLKLDETVTFNATLNITNLASGGSVNVGFYIDEVDTEHEIGNISTNFTSDRTKSVELENWTVWNFGEVNIAGDHNMTVVVDPGNKIHETNESNNIYIQKIHVRAPELMVTNISFDPELPEEGDIVNITVTIANYGDKNATDVTLSVYDWADRHIKNVAGLEEYCGFPKIEVKRENATAMRLYLDLDIEGGEVCIQNSTGEQIKCHTDSFHGWTPWMLKNNITVVTNGDAYAKVSKIYYLEKSSGIDSATYNLTINESSNIPVNWTAFPVGERLITAIIDPDTDINIPEYDESNNTLTSCMSVQTADLIVSNLALQFNDTKLKHGDVVTITANVTNAGVDNATNFDVRFFVDDILIENYSGEDLMVGELPRPFVAIWPAIVGKHVIKVEADHENKIDETNETNNINAKEIYVHGAEVSGNESLESLGLHGEILFDNKTQLYDEDEVNITVNVTNSGCLNATNFNVLLFYDYSPCNDYWETCIGQSGPGEPNRYYPGAERIYLQIIDRAKKDNWPVGVSPEKDCNPIDAGDIEIYDAGGNAVLYESNFNSTCNWTQVMEGKSCWIPVEGDTANVSVEGETYETFILYFYPVYQNETSKLFEVIEVPVNSSRGVSMKRNVSVGNFTVMAVIDPENRVPEDNKTDNIITREMEVLRTRDFTVTNVTAAKTNLSDMNRTNITANITNIGYRNGTTKVRFVDYEKESRNHKYYLNNSLSECTNLSDNLSYLPVSPGETFSYEHENLTILHRPGADAIKLNFARIIQYDWSSAEQIPAGEIHIYNESGEEERPSEWPLSGGGGQPLPTGTINSIWIPGDTIYIYTYNADFELSGYTTMNVFNETANVTLNASVAWDETTGNITEMRSEPRDIIRLWNASTGTHNITVIIDPEDETMEQNETNNTCVLQLSVNGTKDPEIVDLIISPLHPENGGNVTITAVVHNNGTEKANFTVDLWMDVLKDSSSGGVPYYNWNITIGGKERYITLLNHTEELSLAPGNTSEVNGTWENISVYGNPTYIVRAIVDPLDEIDELNENNNEKSEEIIMNYPDLTVAGFKSPTRAERNASAIIENKGAVDASEFNVSFELLKHEPSAERTGVLNITIDNTSGIRNITMEGATKIRIHFASLDTTGENSYIDISGIGRDGKLHHVKTYESEKLENEWTPWWLHGDTISIDYVNADFYIDGYECGNIYKKEGASKMRICFDWFDTKGVNSYIDVYEKKGGEEEEEWNRVETYSGEELWGECTPWANGDTILIDYTNAHFHIKELWWKEEDIERIKTLNASERVNVLLPTWEYEGVEVLNVTVDPDEEVIEQKEDNNTKTGTIYADLVTKGLGTVFAWDGELKGVNATIRNDKTLEEERGIIFPVCNFNVTLRDSSGENQTKRIGENETIYGGEEREVSFEVNESMFAANRTYNITVIADSEDEIEEIDETNNGDSTPVGPDISVGEIYTELIPDGSCRGEVVAVIKNEGNSNAKDFRVRLYLNCTSCTTLGNKTWDRIGVNLGANEEKNLSLPGIPVEPNEFYDVKVVADPPDQEHPGGRVIELDEWNNVGEKLGIGPDLTIPRIEFYTCPEGEPGALREADKLIVYEKHTINVLVNNLDVGAKDVNGTFKLDLWINDSNNNTIFHKNSTIECARPNELTHVDDFLWTPEDKGFYYIKAKVDPFNVTPELDDGNNYYPRGPLNESIWSAWRGQELKVGGPNYKAGRAIKAESYDVYGGMYFDASGDYMVDSDLIGDTYNTTFDNRIPVGATSDVVYLYLYIWGFEEDPDRHKLGKLPKVEMTFGGLQLDNPANYSEFPDATEFNYTYAAFAYTVTEEFYANDSLKAVVKFNGTGVKQYAVAGMGLVVAYTDDDGLRTRYYVGVDGDIIMAKNAEDHTGFKYKDCTKRIIFEDIYNPELANATLITVLAQYKPKASCEGENEDVDRLVFNGGPVGERVETDAFPTIVHYWHYHCRGDIGLIWDEERGERGEYVNLERGQTSYTAEVQSRGSYFFFTNAFLNVMYPPDIEPHVKKDLDATVGNPYNIEVDINNLGLSKAKNFTVIVSITTNGVEVKNETIIDEIKEVGQDGSSIPLTYQQDAQLVEGWVEHNVTVKVDTEDNVKELINKYRKGEENNEINETVTVKVKPAEGRGLPGTGGGGGSGGGWGTGTGEGEGAGEGEGTGGAGGEGAVGGKGGKLISGYLMKGVVAQSDEEGGGGGKGEFSWVAFLLQLAMLAVAVALVGVGYLHERRRQNHKQ